MAIDLESNSSRSRIWASLLFLALFAVAYFESVRILIPHWTGEEDTIYRYGFMVLGCSVYLLYLKKDILLNMPLRPNLWALPLLVLLNIIWFIAVTVGVQTVHLTILPFIVLTATLVCCGARFTGLAFIPIFILLFAIPGWWPIVPLLKDMTTAATEFGLRFIDRPVFVEGYVLNLPNGSFLVDDGCAGLRFLLVTLILSFVCIELFALRIKRGMILLGFSVLLALIANWVRVFWVVVVGDNTHMQSSLVSDHINLGWGIYGVLVLVPFYVMNHVLAGNPQGLILDTIRKPLYKSASSSRVLIAFAVTCAIIFTGVLLMATLTYQQANSREIAIPQQAGNWSVTNPDGELELSQWQPEFVGATLQQQLVYENNGQLVAGNIIYYREQIQGAELISVNNEITDVGPWSLVPETGQTRVLEIDQETTLDVNTAELRSNRGQRIAIVYWYNVGGYNTNNTVMAKVWQIAGLVVGRSDARFIGYATSCGFDCSEAQSTLEKFVSIIFPITQNSI